MTVHNEILKRRPDLAPVFGAPWYMDRKGEVPQGKQPYFQIPIFNYFKVRSRPLQLTCSRPVFQLCSRHHRPRIFGGLNASASMPVEVSV